MAVVEELRGATVVVVERLGGCLAPYVLGKGGWRIGLASSAVLPRHAACAALHEVHKMCIYTRLRARMAAVACASRTPVSEGGG